MKVPPTRPPALPQADHLEELSQLLLLRFTLAVPDWVIRSVGQGLQRGVQASAGTWAPTPAQERSLFAKAEKVGWAAQKELAAKLSTLLARTNAGHTTASDLLMLLKQATRYPTQVLLEAGVPMASRALRDRRKSPRDHYALEPRSLAELHPMIPELVQAWQAAQDRFSPASLSPG